MGARYFVHGSVPQFPGFDCELSTGFSKIPQIIFMYAVQAFSESVRTFSWHGNTLYRIEV
jgi:hypothetical protein